MSLISLTVHTMERMYITVVMMKMQECSVLSQVSIYYYIAGKFCFQKFWQRFKIKFSKMSDAFSLLSSKCMGEADFQSFTFGYMVHYVNM